MARGNTPRVKRRWLETFLQHRFRLQDRGTTVKREIVAGVVVFMSMAYILVLNPRLLFGAMGAQIDLNNPTLTELTQIDTIVNSLFLATALASGVSCILMGFFSNTPLMLAPGMGLNSFFTYQVAGGQLGLGWELALAAALVSGILFLILSVTGLRAKVLDTLPTAIKYSIPVAIGFYITYVGLMNAGIIKTTGVNNTLPEIQNLLSPASVLALFGIILAFILYIKHVRGYLLIAMSITIVFGLIQTALGHVQYDDFGNNLLPQLSNLGDHDWIPNFGDLSFTAGVAWKNLDVITYTGGWVAILVFLFVDFFDSSGIIVVVGEDSHIFAKDSVSDSGTKALTIDAFATVIGASLGTSPITSYAESTNGVIAGARTGLASVTTGVLFLLSVFLLPLFSQFTTPITSAALVLVGLMMIKQIRKIDLSDEVSIFTIFVIIAFTIMTVAIYWGIVFGFIFYVVFMLASKRGEEISKSTWVFTFASILFILVDVYSRFIIV